MKKMLFVAIGLLLVIVSHGYADNHFKIGVLAHRGPVKAMVQWQVTS